MIKSLIYKFFVVILSFTLFSSCVKDSIDTIIPDEQMVRLTFDLNAEFGSSSITTRAPGDPIATAREATIKNARVLIFENKSPQDGYPDPDGRLLVYTEIEKIDDVYNGNVLPMPETPITIVGIANLPDQILVDLQAEYDDVDFHSADYLTYSEFATKYMVKLETVEGVAGKSTIADDEKTLSFKDDGLLPISIDPVQLSELTQETVDGVSFNSKFGYTRIDVIYEPVATNTDEVELIEACLMNVPTTPAYIPTTEPVEYVGYTRRQTSEWNQYSVEQGETAGSPHIIQGIYSYPVIVSNSRGDVNDEARSYAIVGAKTEHSGGLVEYYKISIQYDETNAAGETITNYALERDTRYRLVISQFEGNGYYSFEEALDGEPSNVKYDIKIDASKGNEFVVTNGTLYMALSNTHTHIYATQNNLLEVEFDALSVFYAKNSEVGEMIDPIKRIEIISGEGIEIIDQSLFDAKVVEGEKYNVKLKVTDFEKLAASNNKVDLKIRIGDLVQNVEVEYVPFDNQATDVDRYEHDEYIFAYLDFESPEYYQQWIMLGGNSVLEYSAHTGGGIPLSLSILEDGSRDNFECPVYIYNINGTSTRVLFIQEDYEIVDFSDISTVKAYIGGSMNNTSATELTKEYLSNTYMINSDENKARKYYFPISSRIKDVWENYASADEIKEYTNGVDGVFNLPEDWYCDVVWYDSQRIYDANLEFRRDTPNETTGEERISVVVPARMQNYGNMLVAVKDGAGKILWCWTFWFTDYEPIEIAKVSDPSKGVGTYTMEGYSGINVLNYNDALHRYDGELWDSDGVNDIYKNRFIIDRNIGAFSNTLIGHGTLMDDDDIKCIADPVAGILSFQHANPRPYPGLGALDADGNSIPSFPTDGTGYKSVIEGLRLVRSFCIGVASYSHWMSSTSKAGNLNNIWGDAEYTVNTTNSSSIYNANRAKKSIFDPSPLGWMMTSKFAYDDLARKTVKNAANTYATYETYKGFARFFYVTYRSSNNGAYQRVKSSTGTAEGYLRGNESNKSSSTEDFSFRMDSHTSSSLQASGKASGLSARCVTQAEY